jgi:nitrogen fixation protein FixH
MPHQLDRYVDELPDIEDWIAGDDRVLAFVVVDSNGDPVDITGATVEWALFERPYETDSADAVLDGSDSDVELVTDNRVDLTNGEWEVRVDGSATEDIWGAYTHRPKVTDADGNTASWIGTIDLRA